MRKKLALRLMVLCLVLAACTPPAPTAAPQPPVGEATGVSFTPLPAETDLPEDVPSPTPVVGVPTPVADGWMGYRNPSFGLSFQYPPGWFGPEEYVNENTLRVEIGTDLVYPYGTDPSEREYMLTDSYAIVLQYMKENTNTYWQDTFLMLAGLSDGESLASDRGLLTRVREINQGDMRGYEFTTTLSETAQTEPFFRREFILADEQNNVVSVAGSPVNVDLSNGVPWRNTYRMIDEAHVLMLYQIVDTIALE